jgi:D-beta-D-heptose 7-phosphate kinase/D-beta-D-heptose 1-phosphate adenosyltransferase
MVDFVTVFHEDTPLQTILTIRPDVLAKGADWGLDGIVGRAEVEGWGGRVEALPLLEGQSTSGIAARILERYSSR